MEYTYEKINDEFEKHIFHFHEQGFHPAIHHFTNPDRLGLDTHSHPFSFQSFILKGSYVEEVFYICEYGTWDSEKIHRKQGDVFTVEANHIHRLIELPEGECFTLVIAGPETNEWKFYDFREDGVYYRLPDEEEFKKLENEGKN